MKTLFCLVCSDNHSVLMVLLKDIPVTYVVLEKLRTLKFNLGKNQFDGKDKQSIIVKPL